MAWLSNIFDRLIQLHKALVLQISLIASGLADRLADHEQANCNTYSCLLVAIYGSISTGTEFDV